MTTALLSRLRRATAWLVARARRLARHPAVASITPIGWVLLLGGAAAAWIGWSRGWLEFRALGVMAAVVLAGRNKAYRRIAAAQAVDVDRD